MQALMERDTELAREGIATGHAIDRDESEIDELAMQILARQPVAGAPCSPS